MNNGELGLGLVRQGTTRGKFFGTLSRIVCNGARAGMVTNPRGPGCGRIWPA